MFAFRSISLPIVLGTFALTIQFAFAGTSEPKLAMGSHEAKLAEVSLHDVVAGHGALEFATSTGWGIGPLHSQRGLAPLGKTFILQYFDAQGSGGSSRPADRQHAPNRPSRKPR